MCFQKTAWSKAGRWPKYKPAADLFRNKLSLDLRDDSQLLRVCLLFHALALSVFTRQPRLALLVLQRSLCPPLLHNIRKVTKVRLWLRLR